jgi:arylsulfatase A-like enzyme
MISHLDAQVGRILDALEASGEIDNTLIVFAGDNGLALGQHGLMGKQSLYEHSIHVPLIFAGPGLPSGETRDGGCYLFDLFPTLCEAVGIDPPQGLSGRSLWPMLRGETGAVRERMYFAYRHVQRAVRERDWKYIEYNVLDRRRAQLFHVSDDPWELSDRSNDPDQQQRVRAMRDGLRELAHEHGDTREDGRVFYGTA